ncbi:hypothetical protein [Frischella perrara]|uniref:hypothetical protein n=1 Tax=Frischella perrara TaxID=1267021 RepID=UPI0023F45657|nr:hypothetical protein [Frischella perrara]
MLILSANDIQQIYTMRDAIEADKKALKAYTEGQCSVPLRSHFRLQHGQTLIMPAHIKNTDICGLKIVSIFPDNPKLGKPSVPAQVFILEPQTGEVCAIIDGTYLTQLRTGAVQGAATELLAKKHCINAVLIGTGGQAASQLEAMLTVRQLKNVAVYGLNKSKAQQFIYDMNKRFAHFGANIYYSDNLDEDIAQADIITTVTTSNQTTFNGECVKAGTHINGIGSYRPEMHEIPPNIVEQAAIKVLDTKEGVFSEAGDIIDPINNGMVRPDQFIELGELILNEQRGRQNEDQITLFKSVGTAVLDVYVGYDIYCKAKAMNIGTYI